MSEEKTSLTKIMKKANIELIGLDPDIDNPDKPVKNNKRGRPKKAPTTSEEAIKNIPLNMRLLFDDIQRYLMDLDLPNTHDVLVEKPLKVRKAVYAEFESLCKGQLTFSKEELVSIALYQFIRRYKDDNDESV